MFIIFINLRVIMASLGQIIGHKLPKEISKIRFYLRQDSPILYKTHKVQNKHKTNFCKNKLAIH